MKKLEADSVRKKEKKVYQIIKITGIHPQALANLHTFLKDSKSEKRYWTMDPKDKKMEKIPFAEILSSKMDSKHSTYTVELKVEMSVEVNPYADRQERTDHFFLYPSISLLRGIYSALGGFYCDDETVVNV